MMILDSLPDEVLASLEIRNASWRRMAENAPGLEFVASDLARWVPGSVVRVAFLDGDTDLHDAVARATDQISEACNLRLDFGSDGSGAYRRWREDDEDYAAEIRVSFDLGGYFSLVGTDSTDRSVGLPGEPVGGGPNQRSLNLGGFAAQRPDRWEGTVRHEFLHALAFHHSHQNLRGPCEVEFRWDDDPGYVPTRDPRVVFVPDSQGRRPGIYTFLAGPPNRWPRHRVDHNLRTEDDPAVVVGPFDPASVMLYRFPSFFYKSDPSRCAPTGNGVDLSDGDKRGLSLLYPHDAEGLSLLHSRAAVLQGALQAATEPVRESLPEQGGLYRDRALTLLGGLTGENV